jgi:hypothetical protein
MYPVSPTGRGAALRTQLVMSSNLSPGTTSYLTWRVRAGWSATSLENWRSFGMAVRLSYSPPLSSMGIRRIRLAAPLGKSVFSIGESGFESLDTHQLCALSPTAEAPDLRSGQSEFESQRGTIRTASPGRGLRPQPEWTAFESSAVCQLISGEGSEAYVGFQPSPTK